MPSGTNPKTRVRIAFLSLFVVMIALAAGIYWVDDLSSLHEEIAARESQAALQGITEPAQIDEALRQHPTNKFLQMTAMATRAANETDAASEKLLNEVEPPAIAKAGDLGAASRNDLEALRRDLKTAEVNATMVMPRYIALLKTERGKVEKYALSLHLGKDDISRLLDHIDKRHAEITALASRMLPVRADFYRAYENYVAFLLREYGAYKMEDGQIIFPLQPTVNRYNAAADALTLAGKRIVELAEERKSLIKSQQERWLQFVSGK